MFFTSASFILFAAVTLLLYFTVPKRIQWWVLLTSSLVFYALAGWADGKLYLPFILYTAIVTYVTSRVLQRRADREDAYVAAHRDDMTKAERKAYRAKEKKKRFAILCVGLVFGLGLLVGWKLAASFFSDSNGLLGLFGMERAASAAEKEGAFVSQILPLTSWVLPLALSYYTFQSVGYLIDVYRKSACAERNFAKLLLFVSFFPQLVQGPISRFGVLHEQLITPHRFDGFSFRSGLLRVIWGYFKKLILADTVAVAMGILLKTPSAYTGPYVVLLILLYSAQIYGDFTGGIDISIGLAEMMGIRLTENFDRPFSARSTKEYWNRWHITMGSWFTDYVFYPLSVCRPMQKLSSVACDKWGNGFGMRLPVYTATVVTWFLTGVWHGTGWNYIVWGLLNCLVILVSRECEPFYRRFHKRFPRLAASGGWHFWQAARTFLLMGLIRSLDCYRDVPLTFRLWGSILTDWNWGRLLSGEMPLWGLLSLPQWGVVLASVVVICVISHVGKERPVRYRIATSGVLTCLVVCAALILVLIFGRYGIDAAPPIYGGQFR